MIRDTLTTFARATAVSTAATGLALVGDVIDLGPVPPGGSALNRDIGNGKPVWLVITVDTAVTSTAGLSLAFSLVSDAQAAIAADGSATVHYTGPTIAKASLVAGFQYAAVALPQATPAYERYLGILQNVTTTVANGGKFNAFLTFDPPGGTTGWTAYNDAVN